MKVFLVGMSNVTFYLFINLFHLFSYHYAFNIMKTSKVVPNYTLPFRNRFIPCMVKIFFNPLKREYGLFASITYSDDLKEIGRSFWCPVRCDTPGEALPYNGTRHVPRERPRYFFQILHPMTLFLSNLHWMPRFF